MTTICSKKYILSLDPFTGFTVAVYAFERRIAEDAIRCLGGRVHYIGVVGYGLIEAKGSISSDTITANELEKRGWVWQRKTEI